MWTHETRVTSTTNLFGSSSFSQAEQRVDTFKSLGETLSSLEDENSLESRKTMNQDHIQTTVAKLRTLKFRRRYNGMLIIVKEPSDVQLLLRE